MLTVTTPASETRMLTIEQMRHAAGVEVGDASKDEFLDQVNARLMADIAVACRIAVADGASVPTLFRETLTETIFGDICGQIHLSRRHQVTVVSVTVDGALVAPSGYMVKSEAGILLRLDGDGIPTDWTGRKTVVVYQAGFDTLPMDLIGAARDLAAMRCSEGERDPMVKSERTFIHDVQEVQADYFAPGSGAMRSSTSVPPEVLSRLSRYRNPLRLA